MRRFTQIDKDIIKIILSKDSYGFELQEVLASLIPKNSYVKIWQEKNGVNDYDIKQIRLLLHFEHYLKERDDFFLQLFNFNQIIEYLTQQSLITVIQIIGFDQIEYNSENNPEPISKPVWVHPDETRLSLFSKFFFKYQYTGELTLLKKNNFISHEEKNTNRNFRWTVISCCAAVASVFVAGYTVYTQKDLQVKIENSIKLDSSVLIKSKGDTVKTTPPTRSIRDSTK